MWIRRLSDPARLRGFLFRENHDAADERPSNEATARPSALEKRTSWRRDGAQVMQAEADHDPASIQLPLGVVWSESDPLTSRRLRELRSSRFDQTTSPD